MKPYTDINYYFSDSDNLVLTFLAFLSLRNE